MSDDGAVLVTGATGFIGLEVVRELVRRGMHPTRSRAARRPARPSCVPTSVRAGCTRSGATSGSRTWASHSTTGPS
jgi:nucleoside-diphosphate-sugar epimerase